MKKEFRATFQFRTVMCLSVICMMMLFCVIRVMAICMDTRTVSTSVSNAVTVEIGSGRGEIFFSNGIKITSSDTNYTAVFLPCEQAILRYAELTEGELRDNGLKILRSNKPVTLKTKDEINCIGVYCFKTGQRYSNIFSLEHIIGYTNNENHGVVGLEKAYDDLLYSSSAETASFSVDAKGEYLLGTKPIYDSGMSRGSLYLTLDSEIQKICADSAKKLTKGAIVVIEAETGKIRGMVSRPSFDIENIENYINDTSAPFINRVLCSYSVGSVFKPLVAAALIETGNEDYSYTCTGFCDISDIRFYCNNHLGHGVMNLQKGLALSCNTYFYNAAVQVSAENLTNLAAALGFGSSAELCDGISAVKGNVTSFDNLKYSNAAVANFSIGQGDIAISPLVISNLYAAIANGGYYRSPTLIEGKKENNVFLKQETGELNYVFKKETASILKNYLFQVIENGTGSLAKPTKTTAAGKTATAQTGQYDGEREILNAWFCGIFPRENPKYVVTVFAEDASSGGNDCAPIFKEIADKITEIKN